jgi:hypothetical protein
MNNPYNFNGLLGGFAPRGFDPLRGQSLMGQPARMPAPSNATLGLQQRMQPQQGLLSRAGSGFAGAASGLGSGFAGAARGLGGSFTGEGSSARLSALGASLLQGPSRTPISFGSSLAQGLLAGNIAAQQEEERKFKRGLLEQEMEVAKAKLRPKPTEAENVNIILPDGTTTYGKSDKLGNLTLPDGSKAPAGSRIFGTNIAASKLSDIAPEDLKAKASFQKLSSDAQTFFNSGNKLLEGLDNNKAAATIVGTISGIGSTVYQNVEEAAKALGLPAEKVQDFENIFSKNSIASSKMKSQILDLAYQAAKFRGQEGRGLSDRDVKIFSEIIGSSKPAEEKAEVLRDYMDTIRREVNEKARDLNDSKGLSLIVPNLKIYTPDKALPPQDKILNPDEVEEEYKFDKQGNLVRVM